MKYLRSNLLGLTVACVMAAPVLAQETPEPPRPAKVMEVTTQTTGLRRQYPAIVYPSQEAVLSFRVSGQVVELPVRASHEVGAGDVIAALDQRDFKTAIARLESQRDQARAQLDALIAGARAEEVLALEAAVFAAQAQVDQAREQAERTRTLAERGIVADAKLEQDEATLRVAQANLKTAQEQLKIGRSGGRTEDIEAAEAVLSGLETEVKNARDNLDDATLRAPFDGIIARRDIDNFTNIQAGQPIVLLQRISTVELVFDVPGSDVLIWSGVDPDDISIEVEVTGSAQPMTATELVEFSTQADAGTQTYRARVSVEVPEGARVLPGMVGRVRISTRNAKDLDPVVPVTALATTSDGAPFVWIVDASTNAVSARPVTLGAAQDAVVIVTQGLEPGERIVTAGVSRLREGLVIRPIEKVGN